ncbi:MAG: S1C family serine protease [Planctomycetota bacterium]
MSSLQPPFAPRRSSPLPLVFAGAAFALAAYLVLDRVGVFRTAPNAQPRAVTPRGALAPLEETFVNIFERVSPSVAHINTSTLVNAGYGRVSEKTGSGSGFVWDESGIVVTNDHVVRGVREVQVTVDGFNYAADVLNSSPEHDLAVLRLRGRTHELKPIALGSSESLRVGQSTIAIGNPFGFSQTMTTGIVSALNRHLKSEEGRAMYGLIQVDAAINPGNSGGPLLDSAGRLIGVTTAIYSPSGTNAGLGFAVPVDLVNKIVPRLLANKPTRALLGVRTNYERLTLDPSTGYASGAIFTDVVEGFGAHEAGLKPFEVQRNGRISKYGDVIVAVDGQPVRSWSELPRVLASRVSGDTVKVTALRGLPDAAEKVILDVQLRTADESKKLGM